MRWRLGYVQKAPDDIRWVIDKNEFDELIATKNESAPGPDGIPYRFYRCAGGLGSQFLCNAYKHVIEGGLVPALFASSGTVLIPKSSDVDNNGRIVRSPTAICRGLQWHTSISSRQMTDNIFEIETTTLAHVACTPRESGILLTDFANAHPSVNHSWIFHVLEKAGFPEFICRFLRRIYCDSTTHVSLQE